MEELLFTSESVSEGHPDKLCDQISDAILDACIKEDPKCHVACETFATKNYIIIAGEISSSGKKLNVDYEAIARNVALSIGYDDGTKWQNMPGRCENQFPVARYSDGGGEEIHP